MSEFDLERLRQISELKQVTHFAELPSTNSYALQAARDRTLPETPWLVLTDQQTKGRGRGRNQWWAESGSLTFSLVLSSADSTLSPQHWPQVSLLTGLAVCETFLHCSEHLNVQLKWPNDVLIDQKKLGGILVESVSGSDGLLVIGVGLNINNSQTHAPELLREQVIALFDATGRPWDLTDVLAEFLSTLFNELKRWPSDPDDACSRWNQLCFLTGKFITIQQHDVLRQGYCEGFDRDGALLIRDDSGLHRVITGTVVAVN